VSDHFNHKENPIMKRMTFLLAALGLLLAQFVWAQNAKPDFTGQWTVETLTVESGNAPPPPPGDKQKLDVVHKEPSLHVGELRYTTDGKESVNTVRGIPSKSKVVWKGKQLVIQSETEIGGGQLTTKETWTLSEDGKTLTILKELSGLADATVKMVCKKG
jgi:hypothetical protein